MPQSLTPSFSLTENGLELFHGKTQVLKPHVRWVEILTPHGSLSPQWEEKAGGLRAEAGGVEIRLKAGLHEGPHASLVHLEFSGQNVSDSPVAINLKWTLPLAEQNAEPRWLIPALLYKKNTQMYTGGPPSLVEPPDLSISRNSWWTFRSDLTAVPAVFAWQNGGSVALVMEESSNGHMTSIGLDNRSGSRALVAAWPYREEPRQRDMSKPVDGDNTLPVVTFATLEPGERFSVPFWLYLGDSDPHSFNPLLRETFSWWDALHAPNPWFPAREGIDHAAYGLFTWHYDDKYSALWETCTYEGYYAKNNRHVDRFDMHTGFVSGIPYAHPMRQYGLKYNRPDIARAGRRVIDFCCRNLTPFGTFWSKFSRDNGWETGWPAPHRVGGVCTLGAGSKELQSRTLAEAVIFAARAAQTEPERESRDLWTSAVCRNLDFVCPIIEQHHGNPGQAYDGTDGSVLDWEGEEGLHWITALVEGHRLTGQARYLSAAAQCGKHFEAALRDAYMSGAPEGSHGMVTSEDPQNAVMAYTNLWQVTGERTWLDLALLAAGYHMTFRWQYNTVFPPMSQLGRYDYRTKGLDISSPNNVHLHPFGLIITPELVALWRETGDDYLLKQCRNHLLGCHQMLATHDGVFDARRGMMTERWHQTPNGVPKGGTLQLAHAWCTGLVLYADLFVLENGALYVNGQTGEIICLDALKLERHGAHWSLTNPWETTLTLRVVLRQPGGKKLIVEGRELAGTELTLSPGARVTLVWG
ncbi:MAG: hypothetical protein SFY92_02185 [Verrucomicrobiae bacterium]|nr:hypothetical protein [Verrucomicrobiae bacterium]